MKENLIDIIVYKSNEDIFLSLKDSLNNVAVPKGCEVRIVSKNFGSKYETYNHLMSESEAKFKIYLDENVEIKDRNFLIELLKIFKSNENIGMIGCSGATVLSTHGISFQSAKRCGKVFAGSEQNLLEWSKINGKCQEVEAIDGFFLATQYDISWRSDIFSDNENIFAASAHCVEFKRKGYKTVVANQEKPWIYYKKNNFEINEQERNQFLNEYSKDLFPLVLVLIPTFNRPKYFQIALESAINQTYRNLEIVISDNSTNDETKNLIQNYLSRDSRIKYFYEPKFNADGNWNFCRQYQIKDSKSEYVNWLMDDDIFLPRKIELMMEVYRNNPDVSIVTSLRYTINDEGKVTGNYGALANENSKHSGESVMKLLFHTYHNYVGEPTTVLIKKKFLRDNDLCWSNDEPGFFSIVDMSTWFQLLTKGNLFWINEPLSAYRLHDNAGDANAGYSIKTMLDQSIGWAKEITRCWNKKIVLKTEEDIRLTIVVWLRIAAGFMIKTYMDNYQHERKYLLEKIIANMTQALVNGFIIDWPKEEYKKIFVDDVIENLTH